MDEGSVLDSHYSVPREIQMMQSLVELKTIVDAGDVGVVDDEAGDVRVEGDGEGDQAGVVAWHTQLLVVTLAPWGEGEIKTYIKILKFLRGVVKMIWVLYNIQRELYVSSLHNKYCMFTYRSSGPCCSALSENVNGDTFSPVNVITNFAARLSQK